MIVVCATIRARSGKEREVEASLRAVVENVKEEPGAVMYSLHKAINHPEKFFFYEKYRDQKAFEDHMATPYFKDMIVKIKPLLEKEPNIDMYEEIASIS